LLSAAAAEIAVDVLPPSLTLMGPIVVLLLVLAEPLVLEELERLVFLASLRVIVINVVTAGSCARVQVADLVPAVPDNAAML